jgi:hypothetical protein
VGETGSAAPESSIVVMFDSRIVPAGAMNRVLRLPKRSQYSWTSTAGSTLTRSGSCSDWRLEGCTLSSATIATGAGTSKWMS